MKFLLCITGLLAANFSHAGREGNGGDPCAIDFQKSALEFIKDVRDNAAKYPQFQTLDLETTLHDADYMVVDEPQPVRKYDLIQNSGATNHKKADPDKPLEHDLIVISRHAWDAKENRDPLVRKTLACHELVSLESLEETGVYRLCQGYLAGLMGFPVDSNGLVAKVSASTTKAAMNGIPSGGSKSLYEKLRDLFESSNIPYPLESIAIKSIDEPSRFAGCASASASQPQGWRYDDFVAIKTQMAVKPDNGPLDPGKVSTATWLWSHQLLKQNLGAGSTFDHGVFHWSSDNYETDPKCKDGTTEKELIKNQSSGTSKDGKSFESILRCKNGKVYSSHRFRQVNTFLIVSFSSGDYQYCW